MTTLQESFAKRMKNPKFKAEYEALEPEIEIVKAIIEARQHLGFTQKELAEKSGITQADISRLENGNANPSIKTLKKLATSLNTRLEIKFIPVDDNTDIQEA